MNKKKAFTLVELLAVIVVLAIILVISVPKIINTIDESKKNALKSNMSLLLKTIERETVDSSSIVTYTLTDGVLSPSVSGSGGIDNLNGNITVNEDGFTQLLIFSDKYCAVKNYNDSIVSVFNFDDINCALYENIVVTYDANGGTVGIQNKQIIGNTYGTLATPTRVGYTFAGWYTAADGGTLITSSTSLISNEDHTIYAHWNAATYRITYNANGGTVSPTYKSILYTDETYGELPTPTRAGYTFAGWYTAASGGTAVTSTTPFANKTSHIIYAHWNVTTYRITYNANGGTVSPTYKDMSYTDETYGELATPTRAGYTFAGWYTATSGGTAVTSTTSIATKTGHTIYAHWNVNTYTLTLALNGGTYNGSTNDITYQMVYQETKELIVPAMANHAFLNWTGGTVTNNVFTMGLANITLTANYFVTVAEFVYIAPTTSTPSPYYQFTVPVTGYYQIELWGAQGGQYSTYTVGKGGYVSGKILINMGEKYYIYVGGSGSTASASSTFTSGGYNGGGSANYSAGTGGGSTDIRYGGTTLYNRIMVAAGGGGTGVYASTEIGGNAGGLIGTTGGHNNSSYQGGGGGGTQLAGGTLGSGSVAGTIGTFGIGGTGGYQASFSHGAGAGGGGYWGGAGGSARNGGGGGGSSFISGYLGCVAITSASSTAGICTITDAASNISCSYHYSNKIFTYGSITAGTRSGNGYAKITYIGNSLS